MECFPKCSFPLPEFVTAKIQTNFNLCQQPAEFSVFINHDVRSSSSFLASDDQLDTRQIGTEHWPLSLNVRFYEKSIDVYRVQACIVTERSNAVSCFLNSTLHRSDFPCDRSATQVTSTAVLVLSVLMVLFCFSLLAGVVAVIYRMCQRCRHGKGKKEHLHRQSSQALLPSLQSHKGSIEEDRLTVIEEEAESLVGEEYEHEPIRSPPFYKHSVIHSVHSEEHSDECVRSPRREHKEFVTRSQSSNSSGFGSRADEHEVPPLISAELRHPTIPIQTEIRAYQPAPFATFRPLAQEV